MTIRTGPSLSYWMASEKIPATGALQENTEADVCIVGAGISGLTTAYLLGKEGKSVVVLEADSIGAGQTGRTTAHFANALDDRFFELEKFHGIHGIKKAAQSHSM